MKKLMFAAALAATSMVFAAEPAAQVYDVTLNIKSTAAATATVNNKSNPVAVKAGEEALDIIYRKQANYTWKGLIWGCDCESIDGVWEIVEVCEGAVQLDTVKGCILWDNKDKQVRYMGNGTSLSDIKTVPGAGFGWEWIHLIGKDAKTAECYWFLTQDGTLCEDEVTLFEFTGAGFGTAKLVTVKEDNNYYVQCTSDMAKLSGNFAGKMWKPSVNTKESWGCTYCGGTLELCVYAEDIWAWCEDFDDICGCNVGLFSDEDHTAAYGTWTIQYNSGLSSKLSKSTSIIDAYGFSTKKLPNVYNAIVAAEAAVRGTTTECDYLKEAVDTAEKAVTAAEKECEAVSTANLLAKVAETEKALENANNAYTNAVAAFKVAESNYNASAETASRTLNDSTNCTWVITYKNATGDNVDVAGKGAADLLTEIGKLETAYTLVQVETTTPSASLPAFYFTWAEAKAFAQGLITTAANAEAKAKADEAAKNVCQTTMSTAQAQIGPAQAAADAAKIRYEDRFALQQAAYNNLSDKKEIYNLAVIRYEAAGCGEIE